MAALNLHFSDLVPSDDWELNVLLLDIVKGLKDEELEKVKFLCTGSRGIPKGVLNRLDTAEKLFVHLRERGMISRDNLLLLQAFLWHLDRRDLHQMASEYARRVGDTLYFYAPKGEPENGFRHIQFHVEGNLDRFQRTDLEALRSTVARLLFVPQEFIFLSGVEPSQSLTLTFMIHEQCVSPLRQLFQEHKDSFNQLGVDGLMVDGQEVINPMFPVRRASAPTLTSKDRELRDLYMRSQQLEKWAVENEVRVLESREETQKAKQDVQEWQRRESYYRSLLVCAVEAERNTKTISQRCSLLIDLNL